MYRSKFSSPILFALFLLLLAVPLVAQDHKEGEIIFTGCPTQIRGNHCDSIFYQVVAVHIETMKTSPQIRYHLVDGPGYINEKTGLWVYHPEDLPYGEVHMIEIAASHGSDTTSGEDNCEFLVSIDNRSPRFEAYCGAHFNVLPFDTVRIPVSIFDPDECDTPYVSSAGIHPEPDGWWHFDADQEVMEFVPTYADSGQTFTMWFEGSDDRMLCEVYADIFPSQLIKLGVETVEYARPGDTVDIDVKLLESPLEFWGIEIELGADNDLIKIVDVLHGSAFFGEPEGCNWYSASYRFLFDCRRTSRTRQWPMSYRLSSRWPDPLDSVNCFLPDSLPATIFTVRVEITEEMPEVEAFVPINFFWCFCHSNRLISKEYDQAFYARASFDHEGNYIQPDTLPGYAGNLDECYSQLRGERFRNVEYYNGGVQVIIPPPPSDYVVKVGMEDGDGGLGITRGEFVDVPITLTGFDSANGLGGFDFLVAYDAAKLSFQEAFDGSIYETCGWEYFTYRFGPSGVCNDDCPSGMVRVIGIAETNNGPYHPLESCVIDGVGWVGGVPKTLATLRFLTGGQPSFETELVPISFFWLDCGDNTLSHGDGSELYLSEQVYPYDSDSSISDGAVGFPTLVGAQDKCVSSYPDGTVVRRIDFHNGGILIAAGQITGVDDNSDLGLPIDFALNQNYPNPFNPATSISYDLPKSSRVSIAVFNLLGRRVATLLDETKPAGRHTARWSGHDASGNPVSSGVYFYRISAGEFEATRKMLLLK